MLGISYFSSLPLLPFICIGIVLQLIIALVAYIKKALTISGIILAIFMGATIFYSLNMTGWVLLFSFFGSCTLLGKFSHKHRKYDVDSIQEKGTCRDYLQVFANGGLAMICAVLYGITKNSLFIALFGASLAESTSDTFAGEIGILSKKQPINIITLKPVTRGISGGVTLLGMFGALFGSSFISLLWYFFFAISVPFFYEKPLIWTLLVNFSGFFGNIIDSISGATFQALFWDDVNNKYTEKSSRDGRKLQLVHGKSWANNDFINLFSNTASILICYLLSIIIW